MEYHHTGVLFVLFVSYSVCTFVGSNSKIDCQININEASFEITVNNVLWFKSTPPALHVDKTWFVYGANKNPLIISNSTNNEVKTSQLFGKYLQSTITFQANDINYKIGWNIYQEIQMIEFTQNYPNGAEETSLHDPFQVMSSFPSFSLSEDQTNKLPTLKTLTWQSLWDNGTMGIGFDHIYGGLEGGVPVIMWNQTDEYPSDVAILSPFSNFMVGYQVPKFNHPEVKSFACGLTGMLQSIPIEFNHSTVLYFGQDGINNTLAEWGKILLQQGNKQRKFHSDLATSSLGYWTDNGAYYYYHTLTDIPNSNYEQTMIAVSDYHQKEQIPVTYYQFDSWWYYKSSPADGNCTLFDCGGGVVSWTPMPSIFPNGMNSIQEKLGKPLILHNRYWSVNNNYTNDYTFINGVFESLPNDNSFFPYLLQTAKDWNVVTYEQDWLVKQYSAMAATQNNVETAMNWLHQMGNAALDLGLSIQYCMPLPQFWLASTEIQSVTHSRVSDDYLHGQNQWNIGKTSMLVWSLGLYPFKDVMWTTGNQPGNPFNLNESNPQMEVIISVLTSGPVAFGDGIGFTNKTLIMSTCNQNGLVLGASVPAIPIEKYFGSSPPSGEIWSSYTEIFDLRWAYLISISITDDYTIFPKDLKLIDDKYEKYYAWNYNDSNLTSISLFSSSNPIYLDSTPGGTVNGQQYFEFYRIAPVFYNNWSFIGEVDKIISVSPVRVADFYFYSDGFRITFNICENEQITVVCINPHQQIIETTCTSQNATLYCANDTCSCSS